MLVSSHGVAVATAYPLFGDIPPILKLCGYSNNSSLSYPDGKRYIPEPSLWVLRKADEYMAVIA